jgi:hypothetical protein
LRIDCDGDILRFEEENVAAHGFPVFDIVSTKQHALEIPRPETYICGWQRLPD